MQGRVQPVAHRAVDDFSGALGIQQALDLRLAGKGLIQPVVAALRLDNSGYTRKQRPHHRTGWHHENAAALEDFTASFPAIPEAGEGNYIAVTQPDVVRHPGTIHLAPFIEPVCRDQAMPVPARRAIRRFFGY
jgi:hypothetical protein